MNLMKLELKKTKSKTYFLSAAGILIGILALAILFLFLPNLESSHETDNELFMNWNGIFMLISVLHFVGFGILGTVMASKMIIDEYGSKSAAVILSYPIKRRKILNAKSTITCVFVTLSVLLSFGVILTLSYITAKILGLELSGSVSSFIVTVPCLGILTGLMSSAMSIISITIGQKKHSVPTAIVSSFIMGCLLAQCFSFSYKHILSVTAAVCAVFVITAAFVYKIVGKNIDEMEV